MHVRALEIASELVLLGVQVFTLLYTISTSSFLDVLGHVLAYHFDILVPNFALGPKVLLDLYPSTS